MKISGRFIAVFLLVGIAAVGCGSDEDKGPMERAGKAADEALDKAREQAGKAMERAGETMKDAGENLRRNEKTP